MKRLDKIPKDWISLKHLARLNGMQRDKARNWLFQEISLKDMTFLPYGGKKQYGLLKKNIPPYMRLMEKDPPPQQITIRKFSVNLKLNPKEIRPPSEFSTICSLEKKYPNLSLDWKKTLIYLYFDGHTNLAEYFYIPWKNDFALHINEPKFISLVNLNKTRDPESKILTQMENLQREVITLNHARQENIQFPLKEEPQLTPPVLMSIYLSKQDTRIDVFEPNIVREFIEFWFSN